MGNLMKKENKVAAAQKKVREPAFVCGARKFNTIGDAMKLANKTHLRTGIILGIEAA